MAFRTPLKKRQTLRGRITKQSQLLSSLTQVPVAHGTGK